MRRFGANVVVGLLLYAGPAFAQAAPAKAKASTPEIPYNSVPNFLKLPAGMFFGENAGVTLNSKGHIFVYTRNGSSSGHIVAPQAASLYEFGPDGNFINVTFGTFANVYTGWQVVENAAIALNQSADLIVKPGRLCSNGRPAPVNRANYRKFAQVLRDAGTPRSRQRRPRTWIRWSRPPAR